MSLLKQCPKSGFLPVLDNWNSNKEHAIHNYHKDHDYPFIKDC